MKKFLKAVLVKATPQLSTWIASIIFLTASIGHSQNAQPDQLLGRQRNASSDHYVTNQTFDGQSFFKDGNIWTVTREFADTFGMPPDAIDANLKGIEAAAFRIEESSLKLCGMGGKAENCKSSHRCMLDIYVDERRNPLPWATDQKADWHWRYNSSVTLRTASEKDGVAPAKTTSFTPNPVTQHASSLHPFADPATTKEAIYLDNSRIDGDGDLTFNFVNLLGFKRQAIAGLTVVSLSQSCMSPNESKKEVIFRLESRDEIFSPTLKRFHEFVLSSKFTQQLRDALKRQRESEMEYFRYILNRNPGTPSK